MPSMEFRVHQRLPAVVAAVESFQTAVAEVAEPMASRRCAFVVVVVVACLDSRGIPHWAAPTELLSVEPSCQRNPCGQPEPLSAGGR